MFKKLLLFLIAIFSIGVLAEDVLLTWDKSPDATAIGYRLYYGGESGVYTNNISVSNTNLAAITNLAPNTVYYFAAKSFNINNHESVFTKEVSYLTGGMTNNYVYLIFYLNYGQTNQFTNRTLVVFTNPPPAQTYSVRVIITNGPPN